MSGGHQILCPSTGPSYETCGQTIRTTRDEYIKAHIVSSWYVSRYFERWASDPLSKYWTIIRDLRPNHTDEYIKAHIVSSWARLGLQASTRGTYIRRQIALYLNKVACDVEVIEMAQFKEFLTQFTSPRQWVPFRTEWSIYDDNRMIAGQVDSVWYHPESATFHMIEWKVIQEDLDENDGASFSKFGFPPCGRLLDNRFNHYAIQQNLCATVLKNHYGITLQTMWLVQIHSLRDSYKATPVPRFDALAVEVLDISAFGQSWVHHFGGMDSGSEEATRRPEQEEGYASAGPFDRGADSGDMRCRPSGTGKNQCLLKCLRRAGVQVALDRDGPFCVELHATGITCPTWKPYSSVVIKSNFLCRGRRTVVASPT